MNQTKTNGKIKVLNLYAGIGGNRKLWENVEVTAVEINPKIAKIYKKLFPKDKVIVRNAHKYLLKHYKEFDFIWSSPPCPTHSRIRRMAVKTGSYDAVFPDMKLYEEIIFLKHYYDGKWVVENVKSYYTPLIKPIQIDRHYLWSNFHITPIELEYGGNIKKGHSGELSKIKGFDISKYKLDGRRKDSAIRSYINPKLGKHIMDCAFRRKQIKIINY